MKSSVVDIYKEETPKIFNKSLGIIFNGIDNQKPLIVENLIDSSPTAFQCSWIFQTFLNGKGFKVPTSENISKDFWEDYYPNDLLHDVSESCSRHMAAYIHINYNANYEKENFEVIPYTLCRLGEEDSKEFVGKILVSKKGWGKYLKKSEIDVIDTYNPNPEVIQSQVEKAGGWHNYKGQILHFKLSKKYIYGKSPIETSYQFADVENAMGSYYVTTVRRGFNDVTMIRHRKFPDDSSERQFKSDIQKVMGVDGSSSIMLVEDDWDSENKDPGNIKKETLSSEVKAEKYKHFEESSADFIRKSFFNIPPIIYDVEPAKMGNTSGEAIINATKMYNANTLIFRQKLSRLFNELFWNYKNPINSDWEITPFTYDLK